MPLFGSQVLPILHTCDTWCSHRWTTSVLRLTISQVRGHPRVNPRDTRGTPVWSVGKSRSWSRRRLTVCIALYDVLGKIFRIVRLSKFGSSQRIYCWTLNSLNSSETYGYHRRFGFASEYVGKGRQFLFNFTNFSSESCWFVHRYVDQIVDHIFLHIDFICRISLTFCDHQLNAFVPPIPYI